MYYVANHYDYTRGWCNTHPLWYTVTIYHDDIINYHASMVKWLYDNLDNPNRHCRWMISLSNNSSKFRFRYEKQYAWFTLRWG